MFLKSKIYVKVDVLILQFNHSFSQLKALELGIYPHLPQQGDPTKGSIGVTRMSHLWIEKELVKWSDQGVATVVDLWAPFYALYKCMALVNS